MNLGRTGLSVLLGLWYIVSFLPEQIMGQVTRVTNFTLNAAPGDILYVGHIDNMTDRVGQITNKASCTAAFTPAAGTSTISVLDSDPNVISGGNTKPYVQIKLAADAIGVYKYTVTCTEGTFNYKFLGSVVSKRITDLKQNSTDVLRWNVDSSFVTSPDYIGKSLGFWPIGLVEGNNMKISQDPNPSSLLNEFIQTVRPLVLFDNSTGKPTSMDSVRFKYVSMACYMVPAGDFPECLFLLKEDMKTIMTFNYKVKYDNDYRFVKKREFMINYDTAYEFQDCFVQSPNNPGNMYCYFYNAAQGKTNITKFTSSNTNLQSYVLNCKVLDAKMVNGFLFLLFSNSTTDGKVYTAGINGRQADLTSLDQLPTKGVEYIYATVPGQNNCRTVIKDIKNSGGFAPTILLTCDGPKYVIASIDFDALANAMGADQILPLQNAVPLNMDFTRLVDASIGTNFQYLCGNNDHALFLNNQNKRVVYQGIRNIGQILNYDIDFGGANPNAVDKVECSPLSTFVKIPVSGGSSYVLDISTMGRGLAEWQRMNYIYQLQNGMNTFDTSEDGNFALVYQKGKPFYTQSDLLEYNRILAFVKIYDDTVTAPGTYSTNIKISVNTNPDVLTRRYEINYFTSKNNVALKNSMNEVPRGSRIPFYDFYDVSGPYQKIDLDTTTSNQDIVQLYFNVDPTKVGTDVVRPNIAARFVLMDNYFVDCDAKNVVKSDGTTVAFDAAVTTNLIANPVLLGITEGEEGRQIACIFDSTNSSRIQFLYLDVNFKAKVSSILAMPNTTIRDYLTKATYNTNNAFAVGYLSSEYEHAAVFAFFTYTFNTATKEYTFGNDVYTGRHVFNRTQLAPPKSFDKYLVQTWNDPSHNHCPVIIFSEGDLVKPFDFRICSLPTSMYAMFNLKNVTMVQPDKISLEILEGTQSKEFGSTINLYTVQATMLDGGSLTIPNNVQWTLTNTRRFTNWAGGLPWSFIENGDEVYIMTKVIQPWSKMTFSLRAQNCSLSMFKKATNYPTNQVTYQDCSETGVLRPLVSRFGSNIRVIQVNTASTSNTTISDLQIKPQEIMFKSGISVDNLKGINFVFNKGIAGQEIKVPVSAFFGNPPAASSSSTWWIWLLVILLIVGIIGAVGFYMWRREQIRRKTLVDQMMAQDPYAAEVTEKFPQDGSKPPSTVHEF